MTPSALTNTPLPQGLRPTQRKEFEEKKALIVIENTKTYEEKRKPYLTCGKNLLGEIVSEPLVVSRSAESIRKGAALKRERAPKTGSIAGRFPFRPPILVDDC
jgi:hypothetical protein